MDVEGGGGNGERTFPAGFTLDPRNCEEVSGGGTEVSDVRRNLVMNGCEWV